MTSADAQLVIIGGGMSGLAAAWEAHQQGARGVVVCEASDRCGGVLAPATLDTPRGPLTVDAGAEAMLNIRPEAVQLAREVGLSNSIVYPETTHALIASRGGLHPMPKATMMGIPSSHSELSPLLNDSEVSECERLAVQPLPPVSDDVSVADFVAERCGQAVVDRLLEPLLGGVYAGHASKLSARSALPRVWDTAQAGGALWPPASDESGSTSGQPAGGTAAGGAVFAGLEGGMHTLPLALRAVLSIAGCDIRTGTPVDTITRGEGHYVVHLGDERLTAEHVIVALQAPHAARVLRDVAPSAADALQQVEMASMGLVTLAVPQQAPQAHSGVLVPPCEGHTVKAITFSSTKWGWVRENAQQHGVDVMRASLGRAGDDTVDQPDDALVATAVSDLETILDRPIKPIATAVTRWRDALPQYNVGHHHLTERATTAAREEAGSGLALTGSLWAGVGIPACIGHARTTTTTLLTTHA